LQAAKAGLSLKEECEARMKGWNSFFKLDIACTYYAVNTLLICMILVVFSGFCML